MKKIFVCISVLLFGFQVASAQFSDFEINIDGGNTYSTQRQVSLSLRSKYKFQMMLSNRADFFGAEWIAYQTSFPSWTLTGPEGTSKVYVKYKDKEGNVSDPVSDEIILDLTPPENPSVKIDLPQGFTNDESLNVKLILKAKDAKYVMISNTSSFFNTSWEKYDEAYASEGKDWQLELGDDGLKYVFVKFKDIAQNETKIVKDRVMLDTEPPFNCSIMLDGGAKYSINQDKVVDAKLEANGADSIKISEKPDLSDASWEPYQLIRPFTLSDGDGSKTIYVRFKDKAGNTTDIFKDEIYLDVNPPANCSITIDDGAEATEDINKVVTLKLDAEDDVAYMMVSNTPSFSTNQWQNYESVISGWKLDGEQDGKRTVYVKFKDKAGNISSVFTDTILLKRGM